MFPLRLVFFSWEVLRGKALTLDLLKWRGRILANGGFLCGVEGEMIDYILIHCSKTGVLWDLDLLVLWAVFTS